MEVKKKYAEVTVDWKETEIYELVQAILNLPPKNKNKKIKELESKFFNPKKVDIFTEEESVYNDSLLRKKSHNEFKLKDDQYEEFILDELHQKAKRTVLVLSDHLQLNYTIFEEITSPKNVTQILLTKTYAQSDINSVIKLLIRCRKLYQALHEIKLILQLVIKQEEIFDDLLPTCLKSINEPAILSGLAVL